MSSLDGMHPSAAVHLGMKNGIGKVPIQPTPGAIRKQQPNKPKQRKSRTGCLTCKQKRLKCDENKVRPALRPPAAAVGPFCSFCLPSFLYRFSSVSDTLAILRSMYEEGHTV